MKWGLIALVLLVAAPVASAENFLATAHSGSPFVTIYTQDGEDFTKLANPATLPTGIGVGLDFSDNGQFLAVAHLSSPFVTIYSISGTTFTKVADPAILPTGTGSAVDFSPNGGFLAVGHDVSPYVSIYSISGTTFTKLANPATLPTGQVLGVAWSQDSSFLAVAHTNSPYVTIYSRSGTTFTKLADPATLPGSQGLSAEFNEAGNYLAVGTISSPFVTIYSISGATFTKIADPATLPAGPGNGLDFSPSDTMLAVAHTNSPRFTVYDIAGTTFTKRDDPATLPAGTGRDVSFNLDGDQLAVSSGSTPFIQTYSLGSSETTIFGNYDTLPTGDSTGVAFASSSNVNVPLEVFCAEPLAARFGYNFKEGFVFEDAGGNVPQSGYYSTATSDNADYLGLGFDKTSRSYEVHFTIAADTDSRTSTFRIVFSFTDDIPSVGNKGNQLVSSGSARESVRATFVENGNDWDISLHEVVGGVSTEDDSDTIGDNPNVNGNFVFVVDTRTGTEEYRIEREDGTVLLNAALAAGHVEETVGSQWFVHRGGGATLGATMTLVDQESQASGATGSSTCVIDLEGFDSVNAPPPGAPGGQGGADGGTIGEQPYFPGVNVNGFAVASGMSLDQAGWLLGFLLIVGCAGGLALVWLPLGVLGGILGVGMSAAFGLIPIWFVVALVILVLGTVVFLKRGGG